jgi:hypothetical protein
MRVRTLPTSGTSGSCDTTWARARLVSRAQISPRTSMGRWHRATATVYRLAFGELPEHRGDAIEWMTGDAVERAVGRVVTVEDRPVDPVADSTDERMERHDRSRIVSR